MVYRQFVPIIDYRTKNFAEKQVPLLEGPPTFADLDIIEDRS